jgi:tetratricopeptide (TPR) repeat protein
MSRVGRTSGNHWENCRAHFDRGERLYQISRYREALDEFKEAFLLKADPAFLYNIAQCHRNLRNREQAVFFYQRYLSLAPDAPNRPVVEELIAEQKRQLEHDQPTEAEDKNDKTDKKLDLTARPEATEGPVAGLADKPAEEGKWKKARWYLLGALGVGLVAGVALLSVRRSGSLPSGQLGTIDTR